MVETAYQITKDLFVIPDGERYLLYEPRESNVLLVNKAMVQLLQRLQQGDQWVCSAHPELIRQLVKHNMVVKGNHIPAIEFPKQASSFDPQGVSLFLTSACSMRCIYCYSYGGDSPRSMPWPIAKTALDWIISHTLSKGRKRFYVSLHGGGEVTTAADLMKRCVRYAREKADDHRLNVRIEAGLNGVMGHGVCDWVAQNLDGATLSLDGMANIQNAQRPLANGKASFPIVANALRRLDRNEFNYSIRMTVTQERIDQITESVGYIAANFAAQEIQVEPVFLVGRAVDTNLTPVDADLFIDQFKQAKRIAASYKKQLKYSGARLQTQTNAFCKAVTGNSLCITTAGQVTACYEVTEPEDPRSALFFFGRYDVAAKRFIFDEDKVKGLRTLTVENKPYCRKCFCKWHCAGDCPAKLAALGDAWTPDEALRCRINRALTKDQIKDRLNSSPLT